MASSCSFDVVSKIDMQEVKNAVNQTTSDILKRYDFKGSKSSLNLNEKENTITIISDDSFKLKAVIEIFQTKLGKRDLPVKNFIFGKEQDATGNTVRIIVTMQQGISKENGRDITKCIKDLKIKVQSSIQDDQLRVVGKNRDDLQGVISALKEKDFGVSLQFVNYR